MSTDTLPLFDHPTISVILPTYNRAAYLDTAIQSVLAQTFTDWELIVVDDGSTDHTFAVVDAYLHQHRNMRYLKQQNRGVALARNGGIQASFGAFLTFLDSDDAYTPAHLQSRLAYLQARPDLDLIEGGAAIAEDFLVADFFRPGEQISIRECVLGATFFGRRHVFFALGGFDALSYGEDTDLWQRATQQFRTARITHPESYVYTRAPGSISQQASS